MSRFILESVDVLIGAALMILGAILVWQGVRGAEGILKRLGGEACPKS